MKELWSYEKQKRFGRDGTRWHFVSRYFFSPAGEDEPREIYFRDDARTEFGMIRFERYQDNPYRDYETLVNKIMNNRTFRASLVAMATQEIWIKSWK